MERGTGESLLIVVAGNWCRKRIALNLLIGKPCLFLPVTTGYQHTLLNRFCFRSTSIFCRRFAGSRLRLEVARCEGFR